MKKSIAIFLSVFLLFSLAACGENGNETTTQKPSSTTETSTKLSTTSPQSTEPDYDSIPDTMTSENGKYTLAFVTDVGTLKDESFNQGTWNGIKQFARENDISYKYYQPANGNQATDEDRYEAMKTAADSGAEIIVCAGFLQKDALRRAAEEYKDVKFIFIDGTVLYEGGKDKGTPLSNVAAVDFREEESGYIAGYAAVMNGYKKLGFTGGGGGTNPPCCRFGYGYVQGINDAAKKKNITAEVNFSWEYGASFSQSAELQTMLSGWYAGGTEVIFCSGGSMCLSAFAAASANDGAVIGVDVDQSKKSDTVITSALKGISRSAVYILNKAKDKKWDEVGGKLTTLGAKEDAVGLPTENWKLEGFTVEEYEKLLKKLKDGEIKVDRDYEKGLKDENFDNVKLNII